jgi:hypothetical protein
MFNEFKTTLESNFSFRLKKVEENFNRKMKNKDVKKLFFALHKLDLQASNAFYQLCDKVMITNFDSVEGMESILSFLGNFIDDSFFRLEEDLDSETFSRDIAGRAGIPMDKFEKGYKPKYRLVSCDENGISTKELIEHIDLLIQQRKDRLKVIRERLGKK